MGAWFSSWLLLLNQELLALEYIGFQMKNLLKSLYIMR
jgi:hypothetical protein